VNATVSTLIVTYNVRDYLLDTLRAYYETCGPEAEVIVVDNASTDGSAEAVTERFPRARLVRLEQNVGFGRANNRGLELSHSDFVLVMNPDVVVRPGCVNALRRFLIEHPDVGAVGPRLQRPDGRLDLAARRAFPTPAAAFFRFTGLSRLFPRSARFNRYNLGARPVESTQEIDAGTAACLMVRRAAIDKVGFFDPDFFMFGEDLDLCYRLKQSGWKIFYVPAAVAIHVKGTSTRQATRRMLYEFHRAMWIFHKKHYARTTPAPLNGLIWAGIWARWVLLSLVAGITRRSTVSP
jgi:GT2 family glycosyltransferase